MKTLEYYYADGSHVVFDKYTIDTLGVIRNKKTGKVLFTHKVKGYSDTRKERSLHVTVARGRLFDRFIPSPITICARNWSFQM